MRFGAIFTLAAASAIAGAAFAQTNPQPEAVDVAPGEPGGLRLFGDVPWNDLGNQKPVATVQGIDDGRLEVTTLAVTDPGPGAILRVISNTPIPDSIESRARFGGPMSVAGRNTTPRPGPVNNPRMASR